MQHVARKTKFSRQNTAIVVAVVVLSGILAYAPAAVFITGQAQAEPFRDPGRVEGVGTRFEVRGSPFLNPSVDSTEIVRVVLTSAPNLVLIKIESASSATSTEITLGNLSPSATYYKYEDDYHQLQSFVAGAGGTYRYVQDLSRPHLVLLQTVKSTKFISDAPGGGDCQSIGTWTTETKTCLLTQDVGETIQIDSDGVTLDGNGHALRPVGPASFGVFLNGRADVTLKNLRVEGFSSGIFLMNSTQNRIENNTIQMNGDRGVYLFAGDDSNVISGNTVHLNGIGINVYGNGNVVASNTVTGDKTTFRFSIGITVAGAENLVTRNVISSQSSRGIRIALGFNTTVTTNTVTDTDGIGIEIVDQGTNAISGNTLDSSYLDIDIVFSSNNRIFNNNFLGSSVIANSGTGNTFNLLAPVGGNYWSAFDTSAEGCENLNGDSFCDASRLFPGGQDNLPWTTRDGWGVAANLPPAVTDLSQRKSDAVMKVEEGTTTTEDEIVFRGRLNDPDGDLVKLQVELREGDQPFSGAFDGGIVESGFVPSWTSATIRRSGIADGRYHWRGRAVDVQGHASDWQEFGQAGNTDFVVHTVPLYTQIPSDFPSRAATQDWAARQYGNGNYLDCFDKNQGFSTIGSCGCAITSVVMVLRYQGVTAAADNLDVNPATINQWLADSSHQGYFKTGDVDWPKVQFYAKDPASGVFRIAFAKDVSVDVDKVGLATATANLVVQLNKPTPNPVILHEAAVPTRTPEGKLTTTSHFIVADGPITHDGESTYTIRDPKWFSTRYLFDQSAPDVGSQTLKGYRNRFDGIRVYVPTSTTKLAVGEEISIASPAELLLTDPNGRRLGKDPATGAVYNEIAGGSYLEDGLADPDFGSSGAEIERSKTLFIPDSTAGSYSLKVIGTGMGSYTLESRPADGQNLFPSQMLTGHTAPGLAAEYDFNFNPQQVSSTVLKPADTTPPTTTLFVTGTQGKHGWLVSGAEVTLTAEDNPGGVGVFKIEYSLDRGASWQRYEKAFPITGDGTHLVLFRAEDFVGNREEARSAEVKIDTTPPEALVSFDPVAFSLRVEGADNLSQPTVTRNGLTTRIEDLAGHRATVLLEETKIAGKELKTDVRSIQYDNRPPIPLDASLHAEWSLEKDGALKELEQKLQARHFKVEAKYQGKKDETTIKADTDGKKTEETLSYLRIAKLATKQGALSYGILAPFSAEFNGVNSILSAPSSPSLTLTSDFTLETWAKITKAPVPGASYLLAAKWQPPTQRSYLWFYRTVPNSTVKQLILCTSPDGVAISCSALSSATTPAADLGENEWHHLAARVTAGSSTVQQIDFLIDGANYARTNPGLPLPQANQSIFSLGAGKTLDGILAFPCHCRLDEVRVWSRARTDDEIAAGRFHELTGDEPGLAGYWRFTKDFRDATVNHNDLTGENVLFSLDSPPLAGSLVGGTATGQRSLLHTLLANVYAALSGLVRAEGNFWK